MSINVQAIIPYHFTELSDENKATQEIEAIRKRIMDYLHISVGLNINIEKYEDDEDDEYTEPTRYEIEPALFDCTIQLGNGFIVIDTVYKYSHYFYKSDEYAWLRSRFYDIARILGSDYAIVGNEYHGWNHTYTGEKQISDYDFTFQDYLAEFPSIPPIDESLFQKYDSKFYPKPEGIYIDDFAQCKTWHKELSSRFQEYTILTTSPLCGNFIMALKNDVLKILNFKTGEELACGDIDGVNADFCNAGLVIYQGSKCAFYDNKGTQTTQYLPKEYKWQWGPGASCIQVIDTETSNVINCKNL